MGHYGNILSFPGRRQRQLESYQFQQNGPPVMGQWSKHGLQSSLSWLTRRCVEASRSEGKGPCGVGGPRRSGQRAYSDLFKGISQGRLLALIRSQRWKDTPKCCEAHKSESFRHDSCYHPRSSFSRQIARVICHAPLTRHAWPFGVWRRCCGGLVRLEAWAAKRSSSESGTSMDLITD